MRIYTFKITVLSRRMKNERLTEAKKTNHQNYSFPKLNDFKCLHLDFLRLVIDVLISFLQLWTTHTYEKIFPSWVCVHIGENWITYSPKNIWFQAAITYHNRTRGRCNRTSLGNVLRNINRNKAQYDMVNVSL